MFGPKPPPPCPRCKGATIERSVPAPWPGDSPLMPRRKFTWDCEACRVSWENCGICGHGALLRQPAWNDAELCTVSCKGGCGWSCAWRPTREVPGT